MASLRRTSLLFVGILLTADLAAQGPRYQQIADGCAGTLGTPVLAADGSSLPIFGDSFRARLSNAVDGAAIGIIGLDTISWAGHSLPLDLSTIGMPGCLLYTGVRYSKGLVVSNQEANWDIDLPNLPIWLGRSFYQQVLVLDPAANAAGAVMSNVNLGIIDVEKASPLVKIIFPPAKSLTNEHTIMVRGTAVDPDGVAEVRVNGELASTSDGFLNWQVRVPLPTVINNLTVAAGDGLGNLDSSAAQAEVKAWPLLSGPRRLAFDESGTRLLAFSDSKPELISYRPASGDRNVISGPNVGTGPMLYGADKVVLDQGRALVLNNYGLFSVDLSTGNRFTVADASRGWGVSCGFDFALHGRRALVTDHCLDAIVSVDLATGAGGPISAAGRGSGPVFLHPRGIVVDGNRALVSDEARRSILAVDIATGDRSIFSGEGVGTGPEIGRPSFMALDGDRILLVDQLPPAILAVDLATGNRTAVSGRIADSQAQLITIGEGPVFELPWDITVHGNLAMVSDEQLRSTFAVNLDTGLRTEFAPVGTGDGPVLRKPRGVGLGLDSAYLVDAGAPSAVLEIDLKTGDRSMVSGSMVGSGQELVGAAGLAIDAGRAVVTNGGGVPAILSIDLHTGDRAVISDATRGIGPLVDGFALTIHEGQAIVVDRSWARLLAVDLVNGDRREVSGFLTGTGPFFQGLNCVAMHGGEALTVGFVAQSSLMSVALTTGDRRVLSGPGLGTGSDFWSAKGIAMQGDRALVSNGGLMAVDPISGDRTWLAVQGIGFGPLGQYAALAVKDSLAFIATDELTNVGLAALVVVDTITGERVILSRRVSEN